MQRSGANRVETLSKRKADFIEPMECALVSSLPEGQESMSRIALNYGHRR
jgi:hypothetical protein